MKYMLDDLQECDSIRIEVITLRADLKNQSEMLVAKDRNTTYMQSELLKERNYSDSMSSENLYQQVAAAKKHASVRKSRNWWVATAIAGVLSAFAVHLHWKYSEGSDK